MRVQVLLRSVSGVVRNNGVSLYTLLFQEFTPAFARQEVRPLLRRRCGLVLEGVCACVSLPAPQVIGTLMIHTGSKDVGEVDSALTVFQCLTSTLEQAAELAPFAVFLKGCLDYIDALLPHQVSPALCVCVCGPLPGVAHTCAVCAQTRIVYNTLAAIMFGRQFVDKSASAAILVRVPCL